MLGIITIKSHIQNRINSWLEKRIPANQEVILGHKQLFIFSSRSGWVFGAILLLMLIGATNYQNSLAFMLTFFLMAIGLLNIFQTYRNLSGLKLTGLSAQPVFAGEETKFPFLVETERGCLSLGFGFEGTIQTWADFAPGKNKKIEIKFKTLRRGWARPGRIYLNSEYPLGLMRCWSYIDLDQKVLVYPKPIAPSFHHAKNSGAEDEDLNNAKQSGEDYQESRRYNPGDPLPHIDWKVYARTDNLYTKKFDEPQGKEEWIDWDEFEGAEMELRLSFLCYLVLEAEKSQQPYGLKMPNKTISPAVGSSHLQQCLEQLATFSGGQRV